MNYAFGLYNSDAPRTITPYSGFDYSLFNRDCISGMADLPEGSVDVVFADLPYGYTEAPWDQRIPFDELWGALNRVCKEDAAMVFTARDCATGTFASDLIQSNKANYRVTWIWDKVGTSHGLNARTHPLKRFEQVLVFCRGRLTYNPQMTEGDPYVAERTRGNGSELFGAERFQKVVTVNHGTRYPVDIIRIPHDKDRSHSCAKPVALVEHFLKTYSDPGALVLDPTMGSGTTAIAAMRTGRRSVGFETDPEHYATARDRIEREAQMIAFSMTD